MSEQEDVLKAALDIYTNQRSERRGVWVRSGMKGSAFHCYAKAERIFIAAMNDDAEGVLKETLDLINYAAFTHRQAEENNVNGTWPWES